MVVREPIVDINDETRRVVWSAIIGQLTHYNASAQVFTSGDGQTRVVWIADFLPNEAGSLIESMMEQGMTVMKSDAYRLTV